MYERKARYERRRAHERKRNLMILVSGFCLALTFAFLFGSFLSKAETRESDTVYYKYYTNIEIQPGDTLWDLAAEYMGDQYESRTAYVAEVRQINGLANTDDIVSGESLHCNMAMFVSGTTEFYIDIHTRKCFSFRYESISATGTQKIKFLNYNTKEIRRFDSFIDSNLRILIL